MLMRNVDREQMQAMARPDRTGPAAVVAFAGPVRFTLPAPPSTNTLFRNLPGKGRVKTAAYLDFIQMAIVSIRAQQVPLVSGHVVMNIGIERTKKGADTADIDNRIKALLDVLVKARVIEDDSLVVGFTASWLPRANGLAHVTIMPAGVPFQLRFQPSPDGTCGAWVYSVPQPKGAEHGYQPG